MVFALLISVFFIFVSWRMMPFLVHWRYSSLCYRWQIMVGLRNGLLAPRWSWLLLLKEVFWIQLIRKALQSGQMNKLLDSEEMKTLPSIVEGAVPYKRFNDNRTYYLIRTFQQTQNAYLAFFEKTATHKVSTIHCFFCLLLFTNLSFLLLFAIIRFGYVCWVVFIYHSNSAYIGHHGHHLALPSYYSIQFPHGLQTHPQPA